MSQDDLSNWLKASVENKITTKNTWQSTLIEHFTGINKFKPQENVNFQRASCTLEGCMKVYSTRVDDVSEKTLKLLEIFNKEDESKKKTSSKKRSNFIEKNLQNINLREKECEDFYDPLFSYVLLKNDDCFLQDILEPRKAGTLIFSSPSDFVVMNDEKIEIEANILPICDSLKEFSVDMIIPRQEEFNEPDFGMDYNDYQEESSSNGDEIQTEVPQATINVFEETPFGYFRGWAGPHSWKIETNSGKKVHNTARPKQRFFLDFIQPVDSAILEAKADSILSKEAILGRRKTKNILPEDYTYEIRDLYKFMIKDGYFGLAKTHAASTNGNVEYTNNACDNSDHDDPIDSHALEDTCDFGDNNDLSFHLERSLVLDTNEEKPMKFTKVAKRIDIKKLKENVGMSIQAQKLSLKEIYKDVSCRYSQKEAGDISVHFCLISLLHLANENVFELYNNDDDICIKQQEIIADN